MVWTGFQLPMYILCADELEFGYYKVTFTYIHLSSNMADLHVHIWMNCGLYISAIHVLCFEGKGCL